MPWLGAKGLLPGRGLPVGRPTGLGAGAFGVGADGAAAAGASGSAGGSGAASGVGSGVATGAGVGSGAASGSGSTGAGAGFLEPGAFGVGFAGASEAGASPAGAAEAADFSWSPYSFLNRISTGGSTVDDADLTNSPISLSFSRTNLLSTPNSLASS